MEICLQKSCGDQVTRYRYDALNRLMAVESPNLNAHYTYDSFGRRLTKTLSTGQFETYLYQGERETGVSQNGVITQLRVLGIGNGAELGAAVAIELEGNVYAPLHDHRGNICSLADARSGETVATYRYSAFANLRNLMASHAPGHSRASVWMTKPASSIW